MAIRIMPQVQIEPVRSQTGGLQGGVEPMRDATGRQLQQLGQGLQEAGGAITQAADVFQDNIDIAESARLTNLYDAEAQQELEAPGTGYLATLGMDAVGDRRKQTFDRLQAKRRKLEAMAQNEVQRFNFAQHANRVDARATAMADRHQQDQAVRFRAAETKQRADHGIEQGIKLVGTDEGEVAVATAMRDLDDLADLFGWPKDSAQRADLKQEARDRLHGGVVGWMVQASRASEARQYLAANRGGVSTDLLPKLDERIRQAEKIGQDEARDAAAWDYASRLANSGATLLEQKAAIDKEVTAGMPAEVASKAWALVQNIADQKWQETQRERATARQQLEQAFAKDPNLSVDSLPAKELDAIDRLGMRGEAFEIHRKARENRVADALADGSMSSLQFSRDVRSMGELERLINSLSERLPYGDEAKTPKGIEKTKRIEAKIAEYEQWLDAIALRPRTFQNQGDDPLPALPPGAEPPPFDVKQFTEQVRKALYPGSGR